MPAECHGNAGHQQAVLIGETMVLTHDINPVQESVCLNMGDDSLACRLNDFQIKCIT